MARFVGPVAFADVVVLLEVVGTVDVVETIGRVDTVEIGEDVDTVEAVEIVLLVDVVEVDVVDGTEEEVDETPGCAFPCSMNVI